MIHSHLAVLMNLRNFTTFRDPEEFLKILENPAKQHGKSLEKFTAYLSERWAVLKQQRAVDDDPPSTVKNHLGYIQLDSQLDVFRSHISRC